MKLEAWLRLAKIPYEAKILGGPPRSRTGKAPYVVLPDGRVVCDSAVVIETLGREYDVALDGALTPRERALSTALTRTVEEHLYWVTIFDRWVDDEGWVLTRDAYFAAIPAPLRGLVAALLRRSVKRSAHGQGLRRLTRDEILARATDDLRAIDELYEGGSYFFGEPSTFDATLVASLANLYFSPIRGLGQRAAREFPRLERYAAGVYGELFPDFPRRAPPSH